ncbi:MAG: hypothetical protein WC832_11630, partial [Anaerolineales bacterium]
LNPFYCFLHKSVNFPVSRGSEITGFWFRDITPRAPFENRDYRGNRDYRPVLEPGLPPRAGTGTTAPCWNRDYRSTL